MQLTTFHSISHLFVVLCVLCLCICGVSVCYIVSLYRCMNIATWSHYNASHVPQQDQRRLLQLSPRHTQQPPHQKLTLHLNTASAQ